MTPLSRRELIIGGSAVLGGVVLGGVALSALRGDLPSPTPAPSVDVVTSESWRATRTGTYYIGGRGAGGVIPEHTVPSYLKALEWGAGCLEISVVLSADRVLYCLQDLTLDRTTTLTGEVRTKTSAELDAARVSVPRLGPRWSGANMPPVPRLRDVLEQVKGKAVLCIEPRDPAAYPPLIDLIGELKLQASTIIKLDASSSRIATAKEAGFPVVAYLADSKAATPSAIRTAAGRLDPAQDALLLPAADGTELLPAERFQTAVGTGVPVWASPVHRRYEVKYLSRLGVQGMVAPSIGYLSGAIPPARSDDFPIGELSPGMLTKDPYSNAYGLSWVDEGALTIPTPGRQAFVTFGQFGPINASSYRISFDASFSRLPSDTWQHVSISFAHADDSYYRHRLGAADGYHALLRADGTIGLFAHLEGDPGGHPLVKAKQSTPMKPGVWARLTLDVTPDGLHWGRDDGTAVGAQDNRFRGGYFHIGTSATDGPLRLRNLTVT